MTQMVDQGLRDLDDDIMASYAEDLAEDVDADTRERILEGLIVRYEAYSPFKGAIKNLNMGPHKPEFSLFNNSSAKCC